MAESQRPRNVSAQDRARPTRPPPPVREVRGDDRGAQKNAKALNHRGTEKNQKRFEEKQIVDRMYEPSIQSMGNSQMELIYELKINYQEIVIVILLSFLTSLYLSASVVERSLGLA